MAKEKNQPIGEVECPYKGCSKTAAVFRYRSRSDDPKFRRLGGKLYAVCPSHGRIDDNEGLLEGAKIWGANDKPSGAAPAPGATPAPKAPAKAPAAPVQKTPVKQAQAPAPAPAKASSKLEEWLL